MIRMEKEKIYKPWVFIIAITIVIGIGLVLLRKEAFLQIVGLLMVSVSTVIFIIYYVYRYRKYEKEKLKT